MGTIDLDLDAGGGIAHPARQAQALSQGVDERPKAHALDDPRDVETAPAIMSFDVQGFQVEFLAAPRSWLRCCRNSGTEISPPIGWYW